MMQSFVSLGLTTVLWFFVGYSLCFSGGEGAIIGNLDKMFLHGITPTTMFGNSGFPELVFVAYQMMFAIITPVLITGAFANRITFKAYHYFPCNLAALCLLPFRPYDMGWRLACKNGSY